MLVSHLSKVVDLSFLALRLLIFTEVGGIDTVMNLFSFQFFAKVGSSVPYLWT